MRTHIPQGRPKLDSHPGLLLQRYVSHPADGSEEWSQAKRDILSSAVSAIPCELYKVAYERWQKSLPELTLSSELQTAGRLIVGLGSENVLETGIRLHHTYGMPIIPGSALKGLAAHYCDQVWGETDEKKFKKPTPAEDKAYREFLAGKGPKPEVNFHRLLFGSTDDTGCIVFHDAWFVPDPDEKPLKLDVMTPHHSGWNKVENYEPPTDFDNPIPIPFLSVSGKFLVAVSWHGPSSDKWKDSTELALSLLRDALFEWGVGGKTSSGYGRFDKDKWEEAEKVRRQEAEKQRKQSEEVAALAAMSPIQRSIKEFLENHPDKQAKDYMKLLKELEKPDGRFRASEDQRHVAERVKAGMQADKVWKDKEPHGKRKKFIESILGES